MVRCHSYDQLVPTIWLFIKPSWKIKGMSQKKKKRKILKNKRLLWGERCGD